MELFGERGQRFFVKKQKKKRKEKIRPMTWVQKITGYQI